MRANWQCDGGTLTMTAQPGTDLFVDPAVDPVDRDGATHPDAFRLLGVPAGDFQLISRVTVDFRSTFDAGVLLVYANQRTWAKLCFEYTPQGRPSVVTVVTRGESDDANAFETDEHGLWLRVSRVGRVFAFHASTDRRWWRLVRYFTLETPSAGDPVRIGFMVQSPMGVGCTVVFDDIEFRTEPPIDLRNGT